MTTAPTACETRDSRGFGTLSIAFGLLGALLAYAIMHAAETPWLDPVAFHAGVGLAATLGVVAAWGVQRLASRPRFFRLRWVLVPLAGALVGMGVQALLLRLPTTYAGETIGLTKTDPLTWILVGVPMGAVPAILVMMLLQVTLRMTSRVPALDSRERMIVPVAGICLVLATGSIVKAVAVEVPIVALIIVLATATLAEVVVRDALRARWLQRAFRGQGEFVVVPLQELPSSDLPAFFHGAPSEAVIVKMLGEASYREAARAPIAATAETEDDAVLPLKKRRVVAGAFLVTAALVGLGVGMLAQ